MLVCGPKSSPMVNELLTTAEPAFESSLDEEADAFVDRATGENFVSPRDHDIPELGDYAYFGPTL